MGKIAALTTVLASILTLAVGGSARADDVLAGSDLWVTPPGGAFHDFGATPIPADFFGPGSDPFTSQVDLQGTGAGTCGSDTRVARLADAAPLPVGGQATIPIEIVELSLQSVNPITVTFAGGPTSHWNIEVGLSPNPQQQGSMTIKHPLVDGGTYDSSLPVCPLMTFTQVADPNNVRVLDHCLSFPPLQIGTNNAIWTHNVTLPLKCPGVSTPNFVAGGPHTGPHPGAQPLEGGLPNLVPMMGARALAVFGLLLVATMLVVLHRRRGTHAAS